MKLLNLIFFFLTFVGYSQFCPNLGPDQYLACGVGSTTLTADFSQCVPGSNPNQTTNYGVTNIPYVPQTNTGTSLFMSDDSQQGPFNIGFTFCFFGQTYTQFYVGSNGWISFSPAQPTTFTSATIPSNAFTIPQNCIMGPWQDWHPGVGGQIRYQVQGTAPCRKLVVSWINVPMFSCTNLTGTFHIVIYESTNIIENHIQNKPNCLAWAGGTAVQGLHNNGGTFAVPVPGRNSTQWTANNDARRYTPSGPTVIPTPTWYQVGNPTPIGIGTSITVTPPQAGANYTCQLVYPACNTGWNTCNNIPGQTPDTVFVQPGPPNLLPLTVSFTNPTCFQSCDGTIDVTPSNGIAPFTYLWNNGQNIPNLIDLCEGTYDVLVTDNQGCDVTATVTLTNPPQVVINPIQAIDTICDYSSSELYFVDDNGNGYTYTWTTLGSIIDGQGNDSIYIDWDNNPSGFVPQGVSVIGTNSDGCESLPQDFDIFILDINPTIQQIGPFCDYDNCVDLVVTPIGGNLIGNGIFSNQFCPDVSLIGNNPITYEFTQSNCIFDTTITVVVNPQPILDDINPDDEMVEFCEGDIVNRIYTVESNLNGGTYYWILNGDTTESYSLSQSWDINGYYTIQVYQVVNGCVSEIQSTTVNLTTCPEELIFIPNTFTPDGDEYNQTWLPIFTEGFDPYDYQLTILNRWGEVVFESNNHIIGWLGDYNGKTCTEGIYTWKIEFGNLINDARKVLVGHLTLIR
jgi:gliding motility-associated-like protein